MSRHIVHPPRCAGSYDSLCIYAGAYPIQRQGEIRVYYGGSNGKHSGFRDGFFCMARLRPDGYAGLASEAGGQVGIVETNPIECVGTQCMLRPMPPEAAYGWL